MTEKTGSERRGFLRALGLGTATAASLAAQAPLNQAAAQRADAVPAGQAAKENDAQRRAARYQDSEHVKTFYRTNRYEQ